MIEIKINENIKLKYTIKEFKELIIQEVSLSCNTFEKEFIKTLKLEEMIYFKNTQTTRNIPQQLTKIILTSKQLSLHEIIYRDTSIKKSLYWEDYSYYFDKIEQQIKTNENLKKIFNF